MSWDWTKQEFAQEIEERIEEGESKEQIINFIWSIIEHAYKDRDKMKEVDLFIEMGKHKIGDPMPTLDFGGIQNYNLLKQKAFIMSQNEVEEHINNLHQNNPNDEIVTYFWMKTKEVNT